MTPNRISLQKLFKRLQWKLTKITDKSIKEEDEESPLK